jgi:hypothetical protein
MDPSLRKPKTEQLHLYLHTQDATDFLFLLNRVLLAREKCLFSADAFNNANKTKKTNKNRNRNDASIEHEPAT